MEITIREKIYTAINLTDLNFLPLGNLFLESDGSFTIAEVKDYQSLSSQQQARLTQPMMRKLCDPDVKASAAHAISAIFPDLPKELVSYRGKGDFTLNLGLREILNIAVSCGNELQKQIIQGTTQAPSIMEIPPGKGYSTDDWEIEGLKDTVKSLSSKIEEIESARVKGFANK